MKKIVLCIFLPLVMLSAYAQVSINSNENFNNLKRILNSKNCINCSTAVYMDNNEVIKLSSIKKLPVHVNLVDAKTHIKFVVNLTTFSATANGIKIAITQYPNQISFHYYDQNLNKEKLFIITPHSSKIEVLNYSQNNVTQLSKNIVSLSDNGNKKITLVNPGKLTIVVLIHMSVDPTLYSALIYPIYYDYLVSELTAIMGGQKDIELSMYWYLRNVTDISYDHDGTPEQSLEKFKTNVEQQRAAGFVDPADLYQLVTMPGNLTDSLGIAEPTGPYSMTSLIDDQQFQAHMIGINLHACANGEVLAESNCETIMYNPYSSSYNFCHRFSDKNREFIKDYLNCDD